MNSPKVTFPPMRDTSISVCRNAFLTNFLQAIFIIVFVTVISMESDSGGPVPQGKHSSQNVRLDFTQMLFKSHIRKLN